MKEVRLNVDEQESQPEENVQQVDDLKSDRKESVLASQDGDRVDKEEPKSHVLTDKNSNEAASNHAADDQVPASPTATQQAVKFKSEIITPTKQIELDDDGKANLIHSAVNSDKKVKVAPPPALTDVGAQNPLEAVIELKKRLSCSPTGSTRGTGLRKQFSTLEIQAMKPSERLQRKLEFFNLQDKNPDELEARILTVLDTIKTRFGPARKGKISPQAYKFAEMLAIEAEFGSLYDDLEDEDNDKNPSSWGMFYDAISRKNKFAKLKDCINLAQKEKNSIAKDQQLQMLKEQYAKKAQLKSPIIARKQDNQEEGMEIDHQKILKMVEEEQKKKQGLRMKIINGMIQTILEQDEFEHKRLDSFRNFVKYKYPITSPKRSDAERQKAGIQDFPNTPCRIDDRWQQGMLSKLRSESRSSSPATIKRRSGLGRATTLKEQNLASYLDQSQSLNDQINIKTSMQERVTSHFDTNDSRHNGSLYQGQGGQGQESLQANLDHTMNDRDLEMIGVRQASFGINEAKQSHRSKESNKDLTGNGIKKMEVGLDQMKSKLDDTANFLQSIQPDHVDMPNSHPGRVYQDVKSLKAFKLPKQVVSDDFWKYHLRVSGIQTADQINQYADDVATEMTLFAADRIELLMEHLQEELIKLNELKGKSKKVKRVKRHARKGDDGIIAAGQSVSPRNDKLLINQNANQPTQTSVIEQTPQAQLPGAKISDSNMPDEFVTPQDVTEGKQSVMDAVVPPLGTNDVVLKPTDQMQKNSRGERYDVPSDNDEGQKEAILQPQMESEIVGNTPREFHDWQQANQSAREDQDEAGNDGQTAKYSRSMKKVLKNRHAIAFALLKAIKEDKLSTIDFEWVHAFEGSILEEDTYSGIVPALLALKRFAKTDRGNHSLRQVLARKLFNIKLQTVGGNEEFSQKVDYHARELVQFYLANEEMQRNPEWYRQQYNESAGSSLYKNNALNESKRPASMMRNQESLVDGDNCGTIQLGNTEYDKFVMPDPRIISPRPPATTQPRARVRPAKSQNRVHMSPPSQDRYSPHRNRNAGSAVSIKNFTANQQLFPKVWPAQSLNTSQIIYYQSTNDQTGKGSVLSPRRMRNIQTQHLKRRTRNEVNQSHTITNHTRGPRQIDQTFSLMESQHASTPGQVKIRARVNRSQANQTKTIQERAALLSDRFKQMSSVEASKKATLHYANLPKPTHGKTQLVSRSVVKPQKRNIIKPFSPERQTRLNNQVLKNIVETSISRAVKNRSPQVLHQPQLSHPGSKVTNSYGMAGFLRLQNKLITDQTRVLPSSRRRIVIKNANPSTSIEDAKKEQEETVETLNDVQDDNQRSA